jgi:hypothetical protein
VNLQHNIGTRSWKNRNRKRRSAGRADVLPVSLALCGAASQLGFPLQKADDALAMGGSSSSTSSSTEADDKRKMNAIWLCVPPYQSYQKDETKEYDFIFFEKTRFCQKRPCAWPRV